MSANKSVGLEGIKEGSIFSISGIWWGRGVRSSGKCLTGRLESGTHLKDYIARDLACLDYWNALLSQEGTLSRQPGQQERGCLGPGCLLHVSDKEMCPWICSPHLFICHCRVCVCEKEICPNPKGKKTLSLHSIRCTELCVH